MGAPSILQPALPISPFSDIVINAQPVVLVATIEIAQQQNGRSYGLQAALALPKLYRSTGRSADAHAIPAPALEGFTPTPEFPEIEEAQTQLGFFSHKASERGGNFRSWHRAEVARCLL